MTTPALRLLHNPHLLVLAIALALLAGVSAWQSLPRIEDPHITPRNAAVLTAVPGATAERVDALVTKKLEDALREVAEVKAIESTSSGGISVISVELDDAVTAADNERIFAELRDQLAAAEALLPPGTGRPLLDTKRGGVAYSLVVSVHWDGAGAAPLGILERLSDGLAERLRSLPGTEQVVRFGTVDEEIRIDVDPAELAALGLTIDDVAARLAGADAKEPAGALHSAAQQLRLTVDGELDAVQRVAAVPLLAADDGLVAVGDIAAVSRGAREPPHEIAWADGRRAVLLGVRTRDAVHLDAWAASARALVADAAAGLGGGVGMAVLFDQSRYSGARLAELGTNLIAGAAVVMLVVLLTMGLRAALIVGAALPLSAALTLFGLDLAGIEIHQMSIFGMIIAIGLLIDNAIVMTDAVRARRAAGAAPDAAVAESVQHLAVPLAASTLTTILGFMPIFLLPGNVGDFIGPIAVAVILALTASFVLSLTLIPALAGLAAAPRGRGFWQHGLSSRSLGRAYRALLTTALRHPLLAAALCLVLPVGGFVAAGQLGLQFFPPADRDQFEIQVWAAEESSVGHTAAAVLALEGAIRAAGDVQRVFWVAGSSSPPVYYNQLRNQDRNAAYARGTVQAASPAEARRLVAVLQRELPERFPALRIVVKSFGQGPPVPAPIVLRLVGPELATLKRLGDEVRRTLHLLPEVTESLASIGPDAKTLAVAADERDAGLAGLSLGAIAAQYRSALEGAIGGRVLEDVADLPVRVRYALDHRDDPAALATLPLVSPRAPGEWIPAAALGGLRLAPETAAITRRNGERVNTIEAWLTPDALPIEVTAELRRLLHAQGFTPPPGYRLELGGDSEEQGEAIGLLLAYAPLLGALMIATLVLAFRSFTLAGIVTLIGVLSVGLGMLSLWLAGWPLGFNPILGSAGLVGVAINASIVVLAAIRADARAAAGDIAAITAAVTGATRHIVATTLTTVGGFMPLILFSGGAFWPPLAVVIAGGVGLSMPLGLVLAPALYRIALRVGMVRAAGPVDASHVSAPATCA
jgi:multidrug efflux pump